MNENLTEGEQSRPGRRAAPAATQVNAFAVPEIIAPSAAPVTRRALRGQAAPAQPLPPAREEFGYRPPPAYAQDVLAMPATFPPAGFAPAPQPAVPAARAPEMATVPPRRIEHATADYTREVLAMPATIPAPGIPPQESFFTAPAPATPVPAPAPPRRVEQGYRPSADYAREVLAIPATIPPAGIPAAEETIDFDKLIADEAPVDFDQMIAEEAAPDFEQLAAEEADAAFRQALLPPGAAPAAAGGLNNFAVYGDPEPIRPDLIKPEVIRPPSPFPAAIKAALDVPAPASPPAPAPQSPTEANPLLTAAGAGGLNDFAVYGDPETDRAKAAPASAAPKDPDRDLGITEKPDFYAEPTSGDVIHDVRFSPGKTLSVNHRRVYRADNRGIPIFSPGWKAKMAAAHYRRGLYIAVTVAFVLTAISGGMVYLSVGADSNYVAVAEKGVAVEATVATVKSDVKKSDADAANSGGATTTETAAVQFELDGRKYTRHITDTSTDSTAILGIGSAWKAGDKVRVLVDLEHSGQVLPENTSKPGRFNFLSLSPLLLAAAFVAGAVAAGINTGKMMRIDNAETAAARDQED